MKFNDNIPQVLFFTGYGKLKIITIIYINKGDRLLATPNSLFS
jgi:hypothetical protein